MEEELLVLDVLDMGFAGVDAFLVGFDFLFAEGLPLFEFLDRVA